MEPPTVLSALIALEAAYTDLREMHGIGRDHENPVQKQARAAIAYARKNVDQRARGDSAGKLRAYPKAAL